MEERRKGLGCIWGIILFVLFPACWPILLILFFLGAFDDSN